jgi:hypothetical protein
MRIEPTVGRVVHLRLRGADGPTLNASIAGINTDGTINLGFTHESGVHDAIQNVTLIQEGEIAPPHGPYAEWMPFQKGQAQKNEQDIASLVRDEVARQLSQSKPVGSGMGGAGGVAESTEQQKVKPAA